LFGSTLFQPETIVETWYCVGRVVSNGHDEAIVGREQKRNLNTCQSFDAFAHTHLTQATKCTQSRYEDSVGRVSFGTANKTKHSELIIFRGEYPSKSDLNSKLTKKSMYKPKTYVCNFQNSLMLLFLLRKK